MMQKISSEQKKKKQNISLQTINLKKGILEGKIQQKKMELQLTAWKKSNWMPRTTLSLWLDKLYTGI